MSSGKVKIGNKEVEMLANGASPFIYRRIFHRDFLLAANESEKTDSTALSEMGFVMHMQTQKTMKEILDTVRVEDFWEWAAQFEAFDLPMAYGQIFELYRAQELSLSEPKKNSRKRRGRTRRHS